LPALLTLHRPDGSSERLSLDDVPAHAFHTSVVEFLVNGVPMGIIATQSRDVVALMQAAEASALENGLPVVPQLLR
ncbi:MAG: hypothetical protein HQ453_13360, partial [Actinobacteria bacterium]|nr:hypothetical protein [Actinomycetota bacterium]